MPRGGKSTLLIDNAFVGGQRMEVHTMTCCHCDRVVILNPERTRERGYCQKCDAYVCDSGGCRAECNPFQESIELALKFKGDEPYLLRGPDGEILFDPLKRDARRIH
jgi:hypothetical protein